MAHDVEKIVRELSKVNWSYHDWWHKYDDDVLEQMGKKFGAEAVKKIAEYRKARAAVTRAMVDLAEIVNQADEG